jgi:hypothetical protein
MTAVATPDQEFAKGGTPAPEIAVPTVAVSLPSPSQEPAGSRVSGLPLPKTAHAPTRNKDRKPISLRADHAAHDAILGAASTTLGAKLAAWVPHLSQPTAAALRKKPVLAAFDWVLAAMAAHRR